MTIKTVHVYPPIPDRSFDWTAYHDGEEESGHAGWGRTEAEALADLQRLDEERAEAEDDNEALAERVSPVVDRVMRQFKLGLARRRLRERE